ncbi:unnamed protein product [Adineta steineri]|uniref:Uncharacterized protein n=1 Tax=Adineta steineri TaxID=433720 RepID=A0A814QB00_9BILA|nr:unnamed protein product [Adineta steineri]CAF3628877.1 unnamed protein product [Adineta steineri]
MAFSNLFRRYSTSNETHSTLYTYTDRNAIAETLLDELESQCRNCLTTISQNSQMLNSSTGGSYLSTYNSSLNVLPPSTTTKRHSSVDYSWLTPNNNLFQTTNETYHLSDIIKMELSELIRNVLAEDCTLIINQFRRQIRVQTKLSTPENIIALFRKTIADYIDKKSQNRSSTTNLNDGNNSNTKHNNNNNKTSSGLYSFVRNNRVNPKHQSDDKQHCIAELTEISITSSSNDGTDSTKIRSNSHS